MLRTPRFLFAMLRHTWGLHRSLRSEHGAASFRTRAEKQQQGAQAVLRALGVRLDVRGDVPDRPCLIAPNHTSWLDGFIVAATFPTAMAGRYDVLGWPFIGWVARTMGVVPVYRDRASATAEFVDAVQQRLAAGVSVAAFPEGTTGDGSALRPFKTGMFEAVAGAPYAVLPVYHQVVRAAGRAVTPEEARAFAWFGPEASLLTSYRRTVGAAPVEVVVCVGAPIEAAGETRKTLAARTSEAVAALRAEVQRSGAQETSPHVPQEARNDLDPGR